jgi:hypothetical protein
MLPTIYGDKTAIIVGGLPVYRIEYSKQKRLGKSDKEAKEIARDKFVETTLSSQQSTNIMDLSAIQRGGAFAKAFTMFKTSPLQYYRKNNIAFNNIIRGKATTSDYKRILIYRVVLPAMFQIASQGGIGSINDDGWDISEDDIWNLKRSLILGNVNAIPAFGDFMAWLYDKIIEDKNFDFDASPILSKLERVADKISKDPDKYLQVDSEEFLEAAMAFSTAITPIPFENIKKKGYDVAFEKLPKEFKKSDEDWGKIIQLGLGYSDYIIEDGFNKNYSGSGDGRSGRGRGRGVSRVGGRQ